MRLIDDVELQIVAGGTFLASDAFDAGNGGGASAGGSLGTIMGVFATLAEVMSFFKAVQENPAHLSAECKFTVSNATGTTVYSAECTVTYKP
jgi:hypothetical protein